MVIYIYIYIGCGKLASFFHIAAVGKIGLYGKRKLLVTPPHDGY
jgi:hypothetical protein